MDCPLKKIFLRFPLLTIHTCDVQENAATHTKYMRWLRREFVPCIGEVHTLQKAGYLFPSAVKVKPFKSDKVNFEPLIAALLLVSMSNGLGSENMV